MSLISSISKPFQALAATALLANGCAQDTTPTVTEPAKASPVVVVDTNALHEAPIEDAPPPPDDGDKVDSQTEAFFAEQTKNDQQHELNQLLKPLIKTVSSQEELLFAEIKQCEKISQDQNSHIDLRLAAVDRIELNRGIIDGMCGMRPTTEAE